MTTSSANEGPRWRHHADDASLELAEPLFDLLPAAFYVCDRSGQIVRFNRGAAELWGRRPRLRDPADRFCGSLRMHRLDGGPLAHEACPMAEVLETGVPVRNQEVMIERPDGSRIVALVNIDPLRNAAGEVVGAVNCFRDITEHRRAQELQRQAERRSHALLHGLPVAIYTTDAEGRITFFNEAAAELWGCRPDLGKSEFCGSWKLYWPDGRPLPHDQCPMAICLKEQRPIRGLEALAERPDGTRVPFLPYPVPLFDEEGVLIGALNTLVDITERQAAEAARQHLAAIVTSSADAIISKTLDGVVASWNQGAERLFGYTADEAIGQSVAMLIPEDRFDEELSILARVRSGDRIEHYETVGRRKDGSLVDISLTASPIQAADGAIVGVSKIARDISDRRQAQERQTLLLREMDHRVKNLFAVAGSVVALSVRDAESPRALADAVQDRLGALARAHALAVSKMGADEPTAQAATLHELVAAILSPYDGHVPAGRPRVSITGADRAIPPGAVTSLALLLHEFATNAAKYGALSVPEGFLDVKTEETTEGCALTWTERGGPVVGAAVGTEGFGSALARAALKGEMRGEVSRRWDPQGLVIVLKIGAGNEASRSLG